MEPSSSYPKPILANTISLAPMVRMNTLPFRQLALVHGADYIFSEEIIDRKLISCVRVENPVINTIDYVNAKGGDYSLVISIRPEERPKFIL
jgi:tRNA-dihydrouridine synthase 2